ncbi:MAG: hypothetical protein IT378_05870 [Sandaracinaceae bacterium]|nr:hypothetical protein [Sandaracinaceae bacterium]
MPAIETVVAAVGGLLLGGGVAAIVATQRERRLLRARVEAETRLRRVVVPLLEKRADLLGIPAAKRGSNGEGAVELAVALAGAIHTHEQSADLPFGDTVEIQRGSLGALAEGGSREST